MKEVEYVDVAAAVEDIAVVVAGGGDGGVGDPHEERKGEEHIVVIPSSDHTADYVHMKGVSGTVLEVVLRVAG